MHVCKIFYLKAKWLIFYSSALTLKRYWNNSWMWRMQYKKKNKKNIIHTCIRSVISLFIILVPIKVFTICFCTNCLFRMKPFFLCSINNFTNIWLKFKSEGFFLFFFLISQSATNFSNAWNERAKLLMERWRHAQMSKITTVIDCT